MFAYILILLCLSAAGFLFGGANGLAWGLIIACVLCFVLIGMEA